MEKDKKIPVRISITGLHKTIIDDNSGRAPLSEADETKETATGFYSRRGESIFIIFDTKSMPENTSEIKEGSSVKEPVESLSENQHLSTSPIISNRIKINGTTAEIHKRLSAPTASPMTISHICYSLGELKPGTQETPYGRLDLANLTKDINCSETETGFVCCIAGTMYINNSPVSEFELKIEAVMLKS